MERRLRLSARPAALVVRWECGNRHWRFPRTVEARGKPSAVFHRFHSPSFPPLRSCAFFPKLSNSCLLACWIRLAAALSLSSRDFLQSLHGDPLAQQISHLRVLPQDLPWGRIFLVHLLLLPFGILLPRSNPARPVKVQLRIHILAVEGVHGLRMLCCNVSIAHVFADHRPIFRLRQCVVITPPRPQLSLLDEQLIQQLSYRVIDIFRAVIGMKPTDPERKLHQDSLKHRLQPSLADLRRRSRHLPRVTSSTALM